MNTKKILLSELSKHKILIAALLVLIIVSTGLNAIIPIAEQSLVDNGLITLDIKHGIHMAVLIIAIQILKKIVETVHLVCETKFKQNVIYDIKIKIFEHAMRLKQKNYEDVGFYKIVSDALFDGENILNLFEQNIWEVVGVLIKAIGSVVALYIINRKLIVILAFFLPIRMILNVICKRIVTVLRKKWIADSKEYNACYDNIIQGIDDIKIWGLHKNTIEKMKILVWKICSNDQKIFIIRTLFFNSEELLNSIMTCAIYVVGMYLLLDGQIGVGGIFAFLSYSGYILAPMDMVMHLYTSYHEIFPSIEGLDQFWSLEIENCFYGLQDKINPRELRFENVSYSVNGQKILNNINFEVHVGERILITGDNGSGKSTLFSLLLRLTEPTEGRILINGIPINDIQIDNYRSLFSVVQQNVHLFAGTVSDNIFSDNSTTEIIQRDKLFKKLGIREEIYLEKLLIDSRGNILSGGERQKVGFIRAMLRTGTILLLDEPISNYDGTAREVFRELISEDKTHIMQFMVSHDLKDIEMADKVIYLEKCK